MKQLLKIKTHSLIDIITNSSSEIFCTVNAKSKKFLEDVIKDIMKEFGCTAVNLTVSECYEKDSDGDDTEVEDPGVFEIWYDYETCHEPCTMMGKRIKEVLGEAVVSG